MIGLRLLAVMALVAVNGFFAAAEFSLVAVRVSHVRQLIEQGDARGRLVENLLAQLDRVVSGVQLGVTLTSLGLGALGESTLAQIVRPMLAWLPGNRAAILAHGAALVLAFALLTVMHVVLGELVPKTISLERAGRAALLIARPFSWYLKTFRPAIDLLESSSRRIVRALGIEPSNGHSVPHSAEELQIQINQARERGILAPSEERFMLGAMELGQLSVREIMVPRPDMHVLPVEAPLDQTLALFASTQRSRLPVYEGTVDHILGFVHIKDMLAVLFNQQRGNDRKLADDGAPADAHPSAARPSAAHPVGAHQVGAHPAAAAAATFDLRRLLREVLIVPESKLASDLLIEMRTRRVNLAMVVDEFGSILGLLTLEDLLEPVVGEIHDEYDVIEGPLILGTGPSKTMVFDGAFSLRDLESRYYIPLPDDPGYATLGGFVLAQLGFIPRGGESFDYAGHHFTVVEMDRRRVARVQIQGRANDSRNAEPGTRGSPGTRVTGVDVDNDNGEPPSAVPDATAAGATGSHESSPPAINPVTPVTPARDITGSAGAGEAPETPDKTPAARARSRMHE